MRETRELERLAPPLRESDKKKINELFQPYLFIGRGGEVWATCCGTHKVITTAETDTEYGLLSQPHTPEPKMRFYRPVNEYEAGMRYNCPWCGTVAKVKRTQYCGSRKNLYAFRRVLVLRWWRGALWGVAYSCEKNYCGSYQPNVSTKAIGIYRWKPSRVEYTTRSWYDSPFCSQSIQTAPGKAGSKNKMWPAGNPFSFCNEYGMGFDVVNFDEISKSPMRYCRVENTSDLFEELTACCFYPRQIEMLRKSGLDALVNDLVRNGKKNALLLNWDAEKPRDFLRLPMKTVQELFQAYYPADALLAYRRTKESAARCTELSNIGLPRPRLQKLITRMKNYGLSIERLLRYLEKQKGKAGMQTTVGMWLDYLDQAEKLGMDLSQEIQRLPKDLRKKHDDYSATLAAIAAEERRIEREKRDKEWAAAKKKQEAAFGEKINDMVRKYLWWNEDYLIRPAISAKEIIAEGQKLRHCVGGYADRHLDRKLTILFLRRKDRPGVPLVTIEMQGNKLMQAHGYRNEMEPCEDNPGQAPIRQLYKTLLDEYLQWVKDGSPRTKNGEPRKKIRRKTA